MTGKPNLWQAWQEQGLIADMKTHHMCSQAASARAEADRRMAATHSTGTFLVGSVKLLI